MGEKKKRKSDKNNRIAKHKLGNGPLDIKE